MFKHFKMYIWGCWVCFLSTLFVKPSADLCVSSDGLLDCMDPDCCVQTSCHVTSLCMGSPDPLDIIQETQMSSGPSNLHSFYQRVRFLVGRDSTHVVPGPNPFEAR